MGKLGDMAKTVLIVDDHEHLRHILASILRFSGYEILEAGTGTQAIEKAVSAKPNLILLDLDLPDITGIDAARVIKKNPTTANIPIVACSALITLVRPVRTCSDANQSTLAYWLARVMWTASMIAFPV